MCANVNINANAITRGAVKGWGGVGGATLIRLGA